MMKTLTLGISAAALVMTGAAIAAPGGSRPNPDADGNGIVTRAEAQTHAAAMFTRMDANNDGQLNQADRDLRRQERRAKMFEALDADSNGSVTRDEFMAFKHEGKGDRDGKRHRMGKRGHRGGGMMMMRQADTNNDGAISQAEFSAAASLRFDAIDANKDGQITQEERQAHRQEMRSKWREAKQQRDAG